MKKSKYLNMQSGDWKCTHVGVARVQPKFYQGTRVCSKRPGHRTYYYIWERITSDLKAMKMIRLTASQVRKVLLGKITVEEISVAKEIQRSQAFKEKVSYSFCD